MRIIQLTPGTGSFYCGTCLRDNALVVELRRQGHDAMLVPMYLPPSLDEEAASPEAPVLFGGITAYLQDKLALFRATPRWIDRLLDSPVMLRLAARRAGMTEAWQLGDLTVSMLRGDEGRQRKELDRLAEWLAETRPDVVCLSNVLLIGLARRIREVTGAPVVCTLQGEDGFLDAMTEPYRTQAWQLVSERSRDVAAMIAPSRYYAERMCERASLSAEKVHVVPNGILLDGYEPPIPQDPPVLGYLARMCKDKGLHVLVEAFLLLRAWGRVPGLRLRVAGTVTAADEAFVQTLKNRLAEKGLADQAEFLPNVDRDSKVSFLRNLTVFSAPAAYGESFGLYVIEALAAGVPVVQPRHAAFPELIEATGGGLLCEPNDPESLARAIEELLLDPQKARRVGAAGRQSVLEKFSVEQMARGVLDVFQRAVE